MVSIQMFRQMFRFSILENRRAILYSIECATKLCDDYGVNGRSRVIGADEVTVESPWDFGNGRWAALPSRFSSGGDLSVRFPSRQPESRTVKAPLIRQKYYDGLS